ncbi:EAL domain-containing protein [Duganella sp. FT3S]|uniref:EAL domain-containing protein n=1 Tax=Rugamonas fusca TaxID=2758568 RepID=A0A7W2EIR4_9BURK|nr:EAL domain-containing protein [Rugamonas fusca]MBA5606522.1 EAL domain-containing protein [Rugamonas fusca]
MATTDATGFARYAWLTAGLSLLFCAAFTLYVWSEKRIDRANDLRHESELLSEELRQSSDDLTHMARSYAATGEPAFRRHYDTILAIRDGRAPRPLDYHIIYWDLVPADGHAPRADGPAVPLLTLMRQAGITPAELALLAQSKASSDRLTGIEQSAMALAAPHADAAVRAQASRMLNDATYHQAKADIMRPIMQFQLRLEQRTDASVRDAKQRAVWARHAFLLAGVLLVTLLLRVLWLLRTTLGASVTTLHASIARLGRGDFVTPITVEPGRENSVQGWLAATRAKLASSDASRAAAEEQVRYLAHFDPLTGLANSNQMQLLARQAFADAGRAGQPVALLFLDLDNFKDINDALGHGTGDAVLAELARRLRAQLAHDDVGCRLGGDEFVLLLRGAGRAEAPARAQQLLAAVAAPCRIEQYDLNLSASIGIALYPDDGTELELLLQRADMAMYSAKHEGRNGYRLFAPAMQAHFTRQLQLVAALRQALGSAQLQLVYQPQVALHSGAVVGAEALLRWRHPELGEVAPDEFIPAAEHSGLIVPLGAWVLRQAVRQARTWRDAGLPPLTMAVNLSAAQFRQPGLPELVSQVLREEGLAPDCLELELTEGVAMHDPHGAVHTMNSLHERGVRMAIDDFGTGFSSLSYLKQFKICKLKIDRSFVRDIGDNPEDQAIVAAIVSMARGLGLSTISEGVETEQQLAMLREQGCDEIQGYYYSRPLAADAFEAFVRARLAAVRLASDDGVSANNRTQARPIFGSARV